MVSKMSGETILWNWREGGLRNQRVVNYKDELIAIAEIYEDGKLKTVVGGFLRYGTSTGPVGIVSLPEELKEDVITELVGVYSCREPFKFPFAD